MSATDLRGHRPGLRTADERRFRIEVIRALRKRYKLRVDEASQVVDEYLPSNQMWSLMWFSPQRVALMVGRWAAQDERDAHSHGNLSLYSYQRAVARHLERTYGLPEGRAKTMAGSEPGYLAYARGRHMSPGIAASAIAAKHHSYGTMKLGLRKRHGNRDRDAVVIEPIAGGSRGYFVRGRDLRSGGLAFDSYEAARRHAHSVAYGKPVIDLAARRRHMMSAPRMKTRTRSTRYGDSGRLAATSYYHGREIQVFETGRGYFAHVAGSTGAPGPFPTIREANERGKRLVESERPAANYRRRLRRNKRTGRFTRAR